MTSLSSSLRRVKRSCALLCFGALACAATAQDVHTLRARSLTAVGAQAFLTFDCFRSTEGCDCFYLTDQYRQGAVRFRADTVATLGRHLAAQALPRAPLKRHLRQMPADDPGLRIFGVYQWPEGYHLYYLRESDGPDILHAIAYNARGRYRGLAGQSRRLKP